MCEDPRVEESTLTVADTPAVRQVLARWLASRRLTPRFAAAFASGDEASLTRASACSISSRSALLSAPSATATTRPPAPPR